MLVPSGTTEMPAVPDNLRFAGRRSDYHICPVQHSGAGSEPLHPEHPTRGATSHFALPQPAKTRSSSPLLKTPNSESEGGKQCAFSVQ